MNHGRLHYTKPINVSRKYCFVPPKHTFNFVLLFNILCIEFHETFCEASLNYSQHAECKKIWYCLLWKGEKSHWCKDWGWCKDRSMTVVIFWHSIILLNPTWCTSYTQNLEPPGSVCAPGKEDGACQQKAAGSFQNWILSGEVWLVWPTVSNEYLFCILSPGVHRIYPAMFGTPIYPFRHVCLFLFMY